MAARAKRILCSMSFHSHDSSLASTYCVIKEAVSGLKEFSLQGKRSCKRMVAALGAWVQVLGEPSGRLTQHGDPHQGDFLAAGELGPSVDGDEQLVKAEEGHWR